MKADEIRWNERYAAGGYPTDPKEIVTTFYTLAKVGTALDIAAGNGRNSVFLADRGFAVDAVDISATGLDTIDKKNTKIHTICTDLDHYQIAENKYDLIVNTNFLQRRLFPYIKAGLKKNGILIFQTFMDPRLTGADFDPEKQDRYLQPNELLHSFLSLHIHFYQEKDVQMKTGEILKSATLVGQRLLPEQ